MGEVFFTADTHFGHRGIIPFANRPFGSVEEMDEALVERWNKRVRPGDRVYHLGDFSLWRGPRTGEILDRLHGEIHLVWGNHDVRHEAPFDHVGGRSPPPACRSRSVKLGAA